MRILYLTEPGSFLAKDGNRLVVRKSRDTVIKSVGLEQVESIVIIGQSHLATGLATELLEREIPVTWLSSTGRFFGRLEPTTGHNVERQLLQFNCFNDSSFRLQLARSWITGKLKNSRTLLRRYNRNRNIGLVEDIANEIDRYTSSCEQATSIESIMGIEGHCSKRYFAALGILVPEPFKFEGRSKRPPRDAFNSLLSFGYTLLLYEVFTVLLNKSLQPYMGFMHQPRRGHPALASDLIEEWRSVIVDSLALSLVTGSQIKIDDFQDPGVDGGVYLSRESSKIFIEKFEKKLRSHNQYLPYVDYPVTFRESLAFQAGALTRAIELGDPTAYKPVIVR
ncbi:MAG TPA: CRISPR-associated endonuclease Cas1 [Candidatus Obscuribacterales bacterium]